MRPQHAVLLAEDTISKEHLGLRQNLFRSLANEEPVACVSTPGGARGDLPLREIVRHTTIHVERQAIADALRRTGGNKAKAARLLQVDYKTLHTKVKGYGIEIEGEEPSE